MNGINVYRGLSVLFALTASSMVLSAPTTFEVGSDTIHDTFANNTYDSFDFQNPFSLPPAVFITGNTAGGNSCEVRLQNVDSTGFDAVCAEDSSWDGQHLALPFQYIAVAPGVHTVPVNGGGSLTFEAGCVDSLTDVQHNCTNGCPTESYADINFTDSFSSAPVVLANIQTTNNQLEPSSPPIDPIRPMLSVAIDDVTVDDFDLALDLNKENNIGSVNGERVCWLAVEASSQCGANTLNFSSLGGPASVAFESIITPENIDGWDNGCNPGEGATFTPGCFTNTPVAVATKRSRNEAEGWLRYCALNSGLYRVTIDEQRVGGQNRAHVDESASVMAFGSSFTTPVTMALFEGQQRGSRELSFKWQTESESFNIGFNLWAEVAGEWTQLNRALVPARAQNFGQPESYRKRIKLRDIQLSDITAIGISSYDNTGYEEFFGPFELGQSYGSEAQFVGIDWSNVVSLHEATMQKKGYVKHGSRWIKKRRLERQQAAETLQLSIEVDTDGMVRLSAAQILSELPEWQGQKLSKVALTYKGEPVARLFESNNDVLDANDQLVFYASAQEYPAALYNGSKTYRLSLERNLVSAAQKIDHSSNDSTSVVADYRRRYSQGEQRIYSAISALPDPWFDKELRAIGSPASVDYVFNLNEEILDKPVELIVNLSGGINFPFNENNDEDHHVRITVNGTEVASSRFDGFVAQKISLLVVAELFEQGENTVSVEATGDTAYGADIIYVDQLSLQVSHRLSLEAKASLDFPASTQAQRYQLPAPSHALSVYAWQASGNLAKIVNSNTEDGLFSFNGIDLDHVNEDVHYSLVSDAGFVQASAISRVELPTLPKDGFDYLVVAHPTFMNEDLQRFVQHKSDLGFAVETVDWLDLVDRYNHGVVEPIALSRYLKTLKPKNRPEHVLLVGGHTYDYRDYLGGGTKSFIPTDYRPVNSEFYFAPTDTLMADYDSDEMPDIAIGRWPVRDAQDLKTIVNKTIAWSNNKQSYSERTLLIADASDSARGQRFSNQIETLLKTNGVAENEATLSRIYLDQYLAQDTTTPIDNAKQDLKSMFSAEATGVGLTVFNGHASNSRWTFRNLLNASEVSSFENVGAPTTIMPMACFTTYYEVPQVNTLAHQLLFANEGGAALIVGAQFLSEYYDNSIVASNMYRQLKSKNQSYGRALLEVKREMTPWNDAVTNWTILGDPSLSL